MDGCNDNITKFLLTVFSLQKSRKIGKCSLNRIEERKGDLSIEIEQNSNRRTEWIVVKEVEINVGYMQKQKKSRVEKSREEYRGVKRRREERKKECRGEIE